MNQDDVKALIQSRFKQASEALDDAQFLSKAGRGNRTIVNRAYYAAFYAGLALLQTAGLTPRRHRGVLSFFDRDFVRPGHFSKENSQQIHQLFDLRLEDDYAQMDLISKEEADQALSLSEKFVEAIRTYLVQNQYLDPEDPT